MTAAFVNIENWAPDQVAEWLRGLDDIILPYVHFFLNNKVTGKKLLMLTHSDLDMLDITKLGHQDLILEAVGLLQCLQYGLSTENLQSISLHLSVKAQCLYKLLSQDQDENNKNVRNVTKSRSKGKVTLATLTSIADIISTITHLVSWLDRSPFNSMYELELQRNTVVKIAIELVTATQKDNDQQNTIGSIIQSCQLLSDICDELVCNSQEPLMVQPAWLDLVTLHRKPGEELGMHLQSSYNGVHVIGGINDLSPADLCGKIDKGDELVAVNYQVVIGWTLKKLVAALKEQHSVVVIVIKKRPCHVNYQGVTSSSNNRSRSPKNQVATLPKALHKRRSREGDKPRPSLQELGVVLTDNYIKDTDTDNEVFKSGSESPVLRLKVDSGKTRRATVSGGSPTLELPSLTDIDTAKDSLSIASSDNQNQDSELSEAYEDTANLLNTPSYSGQQFLTVDPPSFTPPNARPESTSSTKSYRDLMGTMSKSQPLLLKMRRLSSDSESSVSSKPDETSYSYSIVGGVLQKAAADTESPILRRHQRMEKKRLDRRVSCKDLGTGECEGWLYRKKKRGGSGIISNKWHKRWCVLKYDNLYCYKAQDDLHAEGVIHLPSFKISPDELENKGLTGAKKMFAFRVYNSGTGFYFASDRQEDMSKWMNKMGLASISYLTTHQLQVPYEHDVEGSDSGDNSGDRDDSPSRWSPNSSHSHSLIQEESSDQNDDMAVMLRSIHSAQLTVDGVDKIKRRTMTPSTNLLEKEIDVVKLKQIQALRRTIKDKEDELLEIETFLHGPITPAKLAKFYDSYTASATRKNRKSSKHSANSSPNHADNTETEV